MSRFTKHPPTLFLSLLLLLQGWMNIRGSAFIFHPALYRSLESIQQHCQGVAQRRGCTLVTTKLATDLSAPPRSFLKRSFVGMTKLTTKGSQRRSSPRLSSSSSHQESSSDNTPVKKKKTATVKKIKTPTPNAANTTSDYTPNNVIPWYHMFTNGDEEYDQYMATEWGFEKVKIRRIRRGSLSTHGSSPNSHHVSSPPLRYSAER